MLSIQILLRQIALGGQLGGWDCGWTGMVTADGVAELFNFNEISLADYVPELVLVPAQPAATPWH